MNKSIFKWLVRYKKWMRDPNWQNLIETFKFRWYMCEICFYDTETDNCDINAGSEVSVWTIIPQIASYIRSNVVGSFDGEVFVIRHIEIGFSLQLSHVVALVFV